VGGLVKSRKEDVNNYRQADRMTLGGALSKAVGYWKATSVA